MCFWKMLVTFAVSENNYKREPIKDKEVKDTTETKTKENKEEE